MKTMFKRVASLSLVVLMTVACFAGCGDKQYAIANYQGQLQDGETKSDYNKELFYRNDKQTSIADPFVLDNTKVDGYYYMYGTEGSLFCYRSQQIYMLIFG